MKIRYIKKEQNNPNIISIDDFFDFLKDNKVITESKRRKYKWDLKIKCLQLLEKQFKETIVFNNPLIIIDVCNFFADWGVFIDCITEIIRKDKKLRENQLYRDLIVLIDNNLIFDSHFTLKIKENPFIKISLNCLPAETINHKPQIHNNNLTVV